jgi:hypothetical protein
LKSARVFGLKIRMSVVKVRKMLLASVQSSFLTFINRATFPKKIAARTEPFCAILDDVPFRPNYHGMST